MDALSAISALVEVMARLRGADGCAWDRAQSFETIAPYTIEEAYEVADAISRHDMAELCEELGDLLLQVVFHARIAEEQGAFDLADVANGIVQKMKRRHPHIFGPDPKKHLSADGVAKTWEDIKAAEKPRESALDGVALGLPALIRADKMSRRAARTGFDWPDPEAALAKVHEELAELKDARSEEHRLEEAGDVLLAVTNYLRLLGIDSETALRLATDKFERRFRAIEKEPGFASATLREKEALWQATKTRS